MAVNIPGIVVVVIFYILILAIGIYAGRRTTQSNSADEIFLANRQMGFLVSLFSLTGGRKTNLNSVIVFMNVRFIIASFQ